MARRDESAGHSHARVRREIFTARRELGNIVTLLGQVNDKLVLLAALLNKALVEDLDTRQSDEQSDEQPKLFEPTSDQD